MLRFAEPGDAAALLAVYAQYIGASVTFEYVLPTEEEFRRRIESISAEYPYLVHVTEAGVIDGYAYAHRFAERAAYQWSAELSVYLDRSARGCGLGKRLYGALMELLKLQGVRTVFGLVTTPNERSDRLHLGMGFTVSGVNHNVGYKNGQWRGVTIYEKPIAPYDPDPAPLKSFREVDREAAEAVLGSFNEKRSVI